MKATAVFVPLFFLLAAASGQEAGSGLRFKPTAGGEFEFNTGVLAGKLRAGATTAGLIPVVHLASGADLARSMGLAGHYRVFTTNRRYGAGAWFWPSETRLTEDGAVEVHWPRAEDRQFEMWAVYRWAAPATLDMETRVRSTVDLPGFESFVAFYFPEQFASSSALVKDGGNGAPAFLAATESGGAWQMFPRDAQAIPLIQDGRWKIEPNPVDWVIRPMLAKPVAMRRDDKSGIAAVMMAPPEDCFAIAMPHQTESHHSVYLSLFGRTIRAGETARARVRLVITQAGPDSNVDELYRRYLAQLR